MEKKIMIVKNKRFIITKTVWKTWILDKNREFSKEMVSIIIKTMKISSMKLRITKLKE